MLGADLRFLLSCTRLSWMLPRLPAPGAPPLSSCSLLLGPDRDSRLHSQCGQTQLYTLQYSA